MPRVNNRTKKCESCGIVFKKPSKLDIKSWNKRRGCSKLCIKKIGRKPLSEKTKLKISNSNRIYPIEINQCFACNKDYIVIRANREKGYAKFCSRDCYWNYCVKEKHWKWVADRTKLKTPINVTIRESLDYKLWRKAVFERDNYTCQQCGARNGNGKEIQLNADHIKPFSMFPELRLAIDNGRTLCVDCHRKTKTFGLGAKKITK